MKLSLLLFSLALTPEVLLAHTGSAEMPREMLRQHIADEFMARRAGHEEPKQPLMLRRPVTTAASATMSVSMLQSAMMASISPLFAAPAGNGALMAASFGAFRPQTRFFWDGTTFYEESDNMPYNMPNLMVGISSWQQQIPIPASYFASTTNPENNAGSLGYGQPNYWRLPLVPTVAASPTLIFTPGSTSNNFQRGAVALASNGVAIFNPANNTGRVSYEIGELDYYGGHCGMADDYHYHIVPMHLSARFGGPLTDDKPVAWALDGYPIYGYVEPDGSARQAVDSLGGHDHGNGWGYHYHAIGNNTVDATHPYGTPQSPYMMTSFKGTVVNFGGQVDGQPEVGPIRASGTGGYTAQPVNGASFGANAYKNPVALTTDGSGHLVENTAPGAVASADNYRLRVTINGTDYDECWRLNRNATPKTVTVTWRLPGATTTTTYTSVNNRITAYPMAGASQLKIPDTSQVIDSTATFGEDADYTTNAQSFTDNGNGTVTDNVTGLMWQKVDNGESTWETALANAATVTTGGYTDWRLPTPSELFSIFNHNNSNPAVNTTYFPSNSPAAEYWWTGEAYGASTTNVWCANAGGGLGPKPKAETISAGGTFRYHARYVRGTKATNGHNYRNNGDGTVTDLDTNLMWTQVPGPAVAWDAALAYAEGLSLGGFSDWRLPNIKELQTLTDYALATATSATNIKPSINRTAFGKVLTNVSVTSGNTAVTCADTTGLVAGMPLVDLNSVASAYISATTVPTVVSVTNATTFVMSAAASATGSGLTFKALVKPTAYWSSSTLKGGTTTEAWVVEAGINTTSAPPRNSQGIISYEVKTSAYPAFAVRTVPAAATTQGRATTVTSNLFPAGQRVSAVGSITATDGTTWTVPAATLFASAPKAPDLYNEYNAVTPGNIAAAQVAIAALPTVVVDPDGEVVTGYVFSDNYFELYVNGVLVGVDPVPYTSFNSCVVKFKAKRPIKYAVRLVDWEENLGLGTELNGGDAYHMGDGGFIASFSDGTVTNNQWKAQTYYIAPLDSAGQVVELADGTRSSSSATHSLTETAYALHYPLPTGWQLPGFSTAGWPAATTYTEAQVGVNNIPAYLNFPAQFSGAGAQFIWSSNLVLDNEVLVTYTGPAASATQISVEQPSGSPLVDGTSTVAWGSVNVGSTVSKTFVIRNTGATALSISGVTIDGVNASNFTVTTSPASSIAAGSSTSLVVQFAPATAGAKTAALHIASSDSAVGAAFDLNLSGAGFVPPPGITGVRTSPNTPTYLDPVWVVAQISAASGATLTSRQLSYGNGTQSTSTVFAETMSSTATVGTAGWDGTGAVYPWTLTSTAGAGNIKQSTAANHGTGGTCGLEMGKGAADPLATMAQTTNAINASGTAGTVSFWVATTNLTAGLGWNFQTSTDNTTWTTRVSEATGTNHVHQLYTYTLTAGERVSTLRIRFQFIGNGVGGPTGPKAYFDDISISITTGSPPTVVTMFDDGLHGDDAAADGLFGAQIPAQTAGTTITYTLSATDSNAATTTTSSASYTVSAVTPQANWSATVAPPVGGNFTLSWPVQSGISYSVQWSTDLIHWNNVFIGPSGTWTDTTAGSAVKRFYRISR